jgi:hypothetical protein
MGKDPIESAIKKIEELIAETYKLEKEYWALKKDIKDGKLVLPHDALIGLDKWFKKKGVK